MPEQLPVISRPREGAVFAGVCAGLARRLGISANALRVVAVITAIAFGGLGVVLYGAGFLLLPRDGEAIAPLPKAIPALQRWPRAVLATVVIAVGVIVTWATGAGPALVPAMVVGVVLWVVVFRPRHAAHQQRTAEPTPFERAAEAWRTRLAEENVPGFEQAESEVQWQQPYTDPFDRLVTDGQPGLPVPAATERPPRNWRLWGLTFALAGSFTAAVLLLNIFFGLPATPLAYLGAVLAALGITGLVAARYGRPPLFTPVTIITGLVAVAQVFPHAGTVGDYTATISEEAQLPAAINRSAGDVSVNLSGLTLSQDRTLKIDVGAGNIRLNLPDRVRTTVRWHVGVGDVSGMGGAMSQIGGADEVTVNPDATGPGLTITVSEGVGDLAVNP